MTRCSHTVPGSGDRQTDWNIDRHCALNLKKKKKKENKKKTLRFFSIKFVFVSREEERGRGFLSNFFWFKKRTDLRER